MNSSSASALLALLLFIPGCIVGEIRDELKSANNQLVCVQYGLDEANKGLDTANDLLQKTNERLDRVENGLTRLDRTNTLIDSVEQGLGRIDSTNNSLTDLEKQLVMLATIEKSLSRLDQHLAGLRKSVSALDGVIPFLDLGGEYTEPTTPPPGEIAISSLPEESPDPAAPPAGDQALAPASPAPDDPKAAATAALVAKRDSLMGVWVSAYPDRSTALVVHSDGTYERSIPSLGGPPGSVPPGQNIIQRGTWKRAGTSVTFTQNAPPAATPAAPDAKPTAPATPAGTVKVPAEQPLQGPSVWTIKVVSLSSKALAVESEGKLVLFARP